MLVRHATLADVPSLVSLEVETLPDEAWGETGFASHLHHQGVLLVAEEGNHLCGFLAAHGALDEWEIYKIAVAPHYQRKGVAWQLLEDLSRCCVGHFFLEVRASNTTAQAFYEKAGFKQLGERRNYYPDGETALLYHK